MYFIVEKAGGLRGTSLQVGQEKNQLAQTILDNSDLRTIFGVCNIPGLGVVALNRKKGRHLLGTNCLT